MDGLNMLGADASIKTSTPGSILNAPLLAATEAMKEQEARDAQWKKESEASEKAWNEQKKEMDKRFDSYRNASKPTEKSWFLRPVLGPIPGAGVVIGSVAIVGVLGLVVKKLVSR